jgi:probable rRNA maturation factor
MSKLAGIPKVDVRNLQRKVPVNAAALQNFASKALPLCLELRKTRTTDLTKLREIFVLVVSDRRMASLHRQFLNQEGPTDVITFSHGEIFISGETARRQAGQFGNSLTRELQLYIVHGLLHLHGFDDQNKIGAQRMKKVQEEILEQTQL